MIAAAAAPHSDPAGATVVLGDGEDDDDEGGRCPDHDEGDGDGGSCVLQGLQMDDEAQLLTWKVWEGGR